METGNWVYAYKLVDAAQLIAQRDRIERTVLQCLGLRPNPDKYHFRIAPLCGWMFFQDLTYAPTAIATWQMVDPVKLVKEFVVALRAAVDAENRRDSSLTKLPKLIPDKLKPVEVIPCYSGKRKLMYWTVVYAVMLRESGAYGSTDLPVRYARLEFSVSTKGKIVGFHWRWHPIEAAVKSPALPFEDDEAHEHSHEEAHEHEGEHEHEAEQVPRMYVMHGESTIQTHLAPYYVIAEGHHSGFRSASKHSLEIVVLKTVSGDEIKLTAVVYGGSGKFSYSWAKWSLIVDDSFEDLGNNPTITLPPGAVIISILVEDLETGVRAQQQESIFFTGEEAEVFV